MLKNKRKLPVVLTGDEREALLAQPNSRYPTGERNYIMLRVMLDTGLRLSETTCLRWDNIHFLSGKLKVQEGKGAKNRILWLSKKIISLLKKWKDRQGIEIGSVEHVFTTLSGVSLNGRYVRAMIKRYSKKAKITKSVSPNTLRHTFAIELYKVTKNIRIVQKALGHSDLSTTMVYSDIVDGELEEAMKSLRSGVA